MKGIAAHRIVGVLITSLSLVACSASQSPEVMQYDLQKNVLSDNSSSPQSKISQLDSLAQVAIEKEDWLTACHAYMQLCQFEVLSNTQIKDSSCERLNMLFPLVQDRELLFNGKLAYYFFAPSESRLTQLKHLSTSDEQHARLTLAQGKIPTHLDRETLPIQDQAQWLYLQGKMHSDKEALHHSAALFSELGDKQKAADSRFLLAQVLWDMGLEKQALAQAVHSYFLLMQVNNDVAQQAVRIWLDAHKTSL